MQDAAVMVIPPPASTNDDRLIDVQLVDVSVNKLPIYLMLGKLNDVSELATNVIKLPQ